MITKQISKSGFVAVIGRPNVGKSTLINSLMRQKIAAVSPRPQTTRKRQMGILTLHDDNLDAQIVFVDTPGVHHPRNKLGELMNRNAIQSIEECDCVLLIVDISQEMTEDDGLLIEHLSSLRSDFPILLAFNKIDLVALQTITDRKNEFLQKIPQAKPIHVSALNSQNLEELIKLILSEMPEGTPFFPEDQTTNLYEREIAADLIREAALILLRDEIPHGIAVRIDQFLERESQGAYIDATLFVERESHKPIVIGDKGGMIKNIGIAARKEIEAMSSRKVFLNLKVKVRKGWRDDEKVLKQFGY